MVRSLEFISWKTFLFYLNNSFHCCSIFLKITDIDQKEPSEGISPWHGQKSPGTHLNARRAGSDAGIKKTSESPFEEEVWQPPSAFIKGLGKQIKKFTQMVKRQQEEQESQTQFP
jgi:hypothetical protein